MDSQGWLRARVMAMCVVALSGCEGSPDVRPSTTANAAKKQIAARYKDPDSVLFTGLAIDAEGTHLCGKLNAKNGYGGYTGFDAFRAEIHGAGAQVKVGTIIERKESLQRISEERDAGHLTGPLQRVIMDNELKLNCLPPLGAFSGPSGRVAIDD